MTSLEKTSKLQDALKVFEIGIRFIDGLTQKGLTKSKVSLINGEAIHIAVWLRKLRSLLDELACPLSLLNAHKKILDQVFQEMGNEFSHRSYPWRPFEQLTMERKCWFLQRAGHIIHALLAGKLCISWREKTKVQDREFLYARSEKTEDYPSGYEESTKISERRALTLLDSFLERPTSPTQDEWKMFWIKACNDQQLAYTNFKNF